MSVYQINLAESNKNIPSNQKIPLQNATLEQSHPLSSSKISFNYVNSAKNIPVSSAQNTQNSYYTVPTANIENIAITNSVQVLAPPPANNCHAISESTVSGNKVENIINIPVESRVEYIPFDKKYIEYEQVQKVYQVPVQTQVIQYEDIITTQQIPVQTTVVDYYEVKKTINYVEQRVQQKVIVNEHHEKKVKRYEYIPVQTRLIHVSKNQDIHNPVVQGILNGSLVSNQSNFTGRASTVINVINQPIVPNNTAYPTSKSIVYGLQNNNMIVNQPVFLNGGYNYNTNNQQFQESQVRQI